MTAPPITVLPSHLEDFAPEKTRASSAPGSVADMKALGYRFALARLAIDLIGIVLIAFALRVAVPKKEVDRMYAAAAAKDPDTPKK